MTLANEDTNSMLTDIAKRSMQINVTMNVVADASSPTWWPNLQPIQVVAQLTQEIEFKLELSKGRP